MDRIRVLLADSHALLRDALPLLLNNQPDMEVIGVASTAAEALHQAAAGQPQLILVDAHLPDRDGISLLPHLRQLAPQSRLILLSTVVSPNFLNSALLAGASGFVVKSSAATVLLEAMRTVHRGGQFIDSALPPLEPEPEWPHSTQEAASIDRLSDREKQVLTWLAHGLRYRAIAEKMGVSVKTVETYRSRLTAKLSFKDRSDMMRFAIEAGILSNVGWKK